MTKAHLFFCRVVSALAIAAGCGGMLVSFRFLASASFEDITAGTSGFVAGAILIGSGLISGAMLSGCARHQESPRGNQLG